MNDSSVGSRVMQPAGVGVPVDMPEAATLLDNWIHQLRIDGVYGNVASLQCTREDAAAALAFAEPFVGGEEAGGTNVDDAFRVFWFAQTILCHVANFVDNYGDTGFGDKPPELNRVTYWAQHLPTKALEEATSAIKDVPVDRVAVVESAKPPSAAPKCKLCKAKIGRGDLCLRITRVEFDCFSAVGVMPRVRRTPRAVVCPECVEASGTRGSRPIDWPLVMYGLPAQCGIAAANQSAADALCSLAVAKWRAARRA